MFNTALVFSASLLVVLMIINIVVSLAASNKSYTIYVPAGVLFVLGIILLSISTGDRIEMMGLGFGGWGAASLFASAIGFIITSLVDTYNHSEQ
ncbi:hypothetical protein FH966_00725 [Lentibacillus cibarius]|uniref:Uncharacterized protein n=1 Tax=Lentibacillus cibarius TaxID=2583219 RepID=A0A549YEP2_9BACI|nr:hypothetical protein [Lentibacillus cibarius]TMN21463.1 hypothetical protein FFL34_04570 [Lentibacillus cibarius]TRM10360.1 hypothetical protein FH966_00725 [Lentibacillus cibarius]